MKKTETLGLNQWELSDPIRMEDFNADNAILETTLRTLTASPVEVIAREDGANAMNGYASEPCRFDICGVNWDEWSCVAVLYTMEGEQDANDSIQLRIPIYEVLGFSRLSGLQHLLTLFFPNRDSSRGVNGIAFGLDPFIIQSETPFSRFSTLAYDFQSSAGHKFYKSSFVLLGIR